MNVHTDISGTDIYTFSKYGLITLKNKFKNIMCARYIP